MAELKTQKNDSDVDTFLANVENETRRNDSQVICKMIQDITKEEPRMWGGSIVGFGDYHYKYASGREGDWMQAGFSPRKAALTVYIMDGFEKHKDLLEKLGKCSISKGCLYIKQLSDVDMTVLRQLITRSVDDIRKGNGIL